MRYLTLALLAALAVPAVASAEAAKCSAGSQILFRQARSPYKIAKITDHRAARPSLLTITSTSADEMNCGQADSGVGCEVAGPAIVKVEGAGDVAYFEVPAGRKAAVLGSKPSVCELD